MWKTLHCSENTEETLNAKGIIVELYFFSNSQYLTHMFFNFFGKKKSVMKFYEHIYSVNLCH